jgi:hypothetical protein
MAWVQQRPKLLRPEDFEACLKSRILWVSVTSVWVMSRRVLDKLGLAIRHVGDSSAAALAAELTQQLVRAGRLWLQPMQHSANLESHYIQRTWLTT